jgi:two-component system, NtrC family, response regulator HydG
MSKFQPQNQLDIQCISLYILCIMDKMKLTSSERQFLSDIYDVISANPFSDERISADLKVAEFDPAESYTERYPKIMEAVAQKVNRLVAGGKSDIRSFEGRDRTLIESALVFHVYHQFFLSFDPLIDKQLASGDTPCRIPFAEDALSQIVRFGFTPEQALHYFAVFFQLRRAYYFILKSIVGRSPCMRGLRESLWNNVATRNLGLYVTKLWNRMEDYSTLLLGETGSGKGISACAIGQSGYIPFNEKKGCFAESFTQAFVSMNLSQFPEQLIESELFGHKKGSFTGAVSDHEGALSRCSRHGAVFLDEIGEVPVPVQIKLLHVLEQRIYSPVGSHEKKRFPGRIIAATNRPLDKLRTEKTFRDDFYYRLCSDVILVPPLRQRIREDPLELDDLVRHTVKRIVGDDSGEVAKGVIDEIHRNVPANYAWPGNVRELEQCTRRILLKQKYEIDRIAGLPGDVEGRLISGVKEGSMNAQQILSHYCTLLYERYGSYEEVARMTALDRRTVKRYIDQWFRDSGR